jgi:hypothetical protein
MAGGKSSEKAGQDEAERTPETFSLLISRV